MYELKFLKTVIENFLDKNEKFFHENCIQWATKGEFTILNYRQGAERNDYNNWCRALVLDSKGTVRSLPFPRFFNRGEKEACDLKIHKCAFLEKLDGCLIGCFFDNKTPIFHTRRLLSNHEPDYNMEITSFRGKKVSLLKVAEKYLKNVEWWEDDYDCCFAFELIHEGTHVVTNYPEDRWGLYLIGGRHLETMQEMCEAELLAITNEMNKTPDVNIRRPHDWRFDNENELQSVLLSMPDDFEGFVAREHFSDRRIKIKKESYMERHHMIDDKRSMRAIIPLWLKGEKEEILAYFPDTQEMFDILDKSYEDFRDCVEGVVKVYQQWMIEKDWTRKDLAQHILVGEGEPKWIHPFIFKLYDRPWKDQNLWDMLVAKSNDVKSIESLLAVTNEDRTGVLDEDVQVV